MTQEQFVTKETAKLAKKASFAWGVQNFYKEGDDTLYTPAIITMADYNWNMLDNTYSAPTQSVLQKWLREVKHIQVWSEFHNQTNASVKGGWIVCYGYFSPAVMDLNYEGGFPTYEAAIEEGLQRVLKHMVEIIKLNSKKK